MTPPKEPEGLHVVLEETQPKADLPLFVHPEKPSTAASRMTRVDLWAERAYERVDRLKYLRELTMNGVEAIDRAIADPACDLKHGDGRIFWTYDPELYAKEGVLKLMCMDNGDGMTYERLDRIRHFSDSISYDIAELISRNHGMGGKVAALARGGYGLLIRTWRDGKGFEAWFWRDPADGTIGLRPLPYKGGWVYVRPIAVDHVCQIEPLTGERIITTHGTTVTVMGESMDEPTIQAPEGVRKPRRWIVAYFNQWFMRVSDALRLDAISEFPAASPEKVVDPHWLQTTIQKVRRIYGQQRYLDMLSTDRPMANRLVKLLFPGGVPDPRPKMPHGVVSVNKRVDKQNVLARLEWYLLDVAGATRSGSVRGSMHFEASNQVLLVYRDEVCEVRRGVRALSSFGIITALPKNVKATIVVRLADDMDVRPSDERMRLELPGGRPMPWDTFHEVFIAQFPPILKRVLESTVRRKVEANKTAEKWTDSFLFDKRNTVFKRSKVGDRWADPDSEIPGRPPRERSDEDEDEGEDGPPRKKPFLFCKDCIRRPIAGVPGIWDQPIPKGQKRPPCYGRVLWQAVNRACPWRRLLPKDATENTDQSFRREAADDDAEGNVQTKKTQERISPPRCEFVREKDRPDLAGFPATYVLAAHTVVINEDYGIFRLLIKTFTNQYAKVYSGQRSVVRDKVRSVLWGFVKVFFQMTVMGCLTNKIPQRVAKELDIDPLGWVTPQFFHWKFQGQMELLRQRLEQNLKHQMPKLKLPTVQEAADAADA